jgi:DNA polymerase III gamma/tau subunit
VDGSFRDGVKILDKVLSQSDDVQLAQIEEAIMGVAGYNVSALVEALTKRDGNTALDELHAATARGMDLVYLTITMMKELRNRILAGESKELVKLVFNLDEVARKIANSPVPELLLEMVIIDWGGGSSNQVNPVNPVNPVKQEAKESTSKTAKTNISDPVISMESGEAKGASVDGSKSPWMQMKEQFLTGKKQDNTTKPSSALAREDGSVTIDEAIEIFS